MARDDVLVRLRLQGAKRFQSDADRSGKSIGRMGDRTKRATNSFRAFGTASIRSNRLITGVGIAARGAGVGLLAAGVGAVAFGKKAFTAFEEAEKVSRQTEAVIKSTGGAANVTGGQVAALAGQISMKTGIDDEAIQAGSNMLLTFKQLRNETGKGNKVFDHATRTLIDMSAALGKDPKTAAIQLGKALNDPVKGISALSRVGVQFTDQQKKQIEGMVKAGNVMGAQKLILRELDSEFGGSAQANATLSQRLATTWENLNEKLGGLLAPTIHKAGQALVTFLQQMQDGTGAGGRFVRILGKVAHWVKVAFGDARDWVRRFIADVRDGDTTVGKLARVVRALAVGGFKVLRGTLTFVVKNFGTLAAIVGPLAAGFLAYKTVMLAVGIATRTAAVATGLLNAAMYANPVGLVIAGLVALAAGFVVAYQKIGWFRNAVNATWGFIKKRWPLILSILTGPVGAATILIVRNWGRIKTAASSVVAFVRSRFNSMVAFVTGLPGRIGRAASGMWDGIKNAFKDVINWIIRGWNSLEFRIPGFDPPGPGKFGGFTVGVPDIPELRARGGAIMHGGRSQIVGERGPELVRLPRGASVTPAPIPAGAGGGLFQINATFVSQLDGREVARNTARYTERDLLRRT